MQPRHDRTLTSTGSPHTIVLGDASDRDVSRWVVQVQDEDSMSVSIAVQGAIMGSDKTGAAALTPTSLEYRNINTGTDVSGASAITAVGKFLVEASGLTVRLVATVNSGEVRIVATPVRG
jgi:hypothetical protein